MLDSLVFTLSVRSLVIVFITEQQQSDYDCEYG